MLLCTKELMPSIKKKGLSRSLKDLERFPKS